MTENCHASPTGPQDARGQTAPPEDPHAPGDPPSTDAVVHAELDTLESLLRGPVDELEARYIAESGCQRVVERIAAIGRGPADTADREWSPERTGRPDDADGSQTEEPREIGQYRLLGRLGAGGMGTVYKALHKKLDRIVAVKLLPDEKVQDAAAVARFEREMRAVGKLDHPNIVRAFDAGEDEGTHFLVMECVEGLDLATLVRRMGGLPVSDACELVRQAAVGLQHVHQHGLVHRDIKPSNLMLTSGRTAPPAEVEQPETATVKILDLGLALLDPLRLPETTELTSVGQMMGTLDYMAPEQGSDSHQVDIRADIYSLGATLYKLLCGKAPFAGKQYDTPVKKMMALAIDQPEPIARRCPEIPAELAAVVERMLAKQPADRFAEPREVAEALAPFCQGADLAALLAAAVEVREPRHREHKSLSTEPHLTSASHDTGSRAVPLHRPAWPARREAAPLTRSGQVDSTGRGRRAGRRIVALALLSLALLLCIVIWVNRTRIEVPDGSIVTVKPDGSVDITLPEQKLPGPTEKETDGEPATEMPELTQPTDPDGWVDLLALVDLERDIYYGSFEQPAEGEVRTRSGVLRLPAQIESSFELEVTFRREENERVAIIFPVAADRNAALVLHRGDAGLDWFELERFEETQSPQRLRKPIPRGAIQFTAHLTVQREQGKVSIEATLDGQRLLAWQGDPARFRFLAGDYFFGRLPEPGLGLAVVWGEKTAAFSSARLRAVDHTQPLGLRADTVAGESVQSEAKVIDILPQAFEHQLGQPISGIALVSRPAEVAGLRSWTVEPRGHRGAIRDLEYSPDGRWLASAGRDGTIRILDAQAESLARILCGHVGSISSLAWSPDGKYLASASEDRTLRFWDVAAGRLLRMFEPDDFRITRLAWSPQGNTIAFVTSQRQIGLWDVASGTVAKFFDAPGGSAIAWSPDGTRLASTGNYRALHIWDAATAELTGTIPLESSGGDIAWSPDGQTIVVCMGERLIVFDASTGAFRVRLRATHLASDPKFSPDGLRLACSTNAGGRQELFDIRSGTALAVDGRLGIYMTSGYIAWSPDGEKLAIGARGGCVRTVAPFRENRLRTALAGFRGTRWTWGANMPAWSPDSTEIALSPETNPTTLRAFRLTDLRQGHRVRVGRCDRAPAADGCWADWISLAWSADGTRIISVGKPSIVWSRDLTQKIGQFDGDFFGAWRAWPQLSPTGRFLAVANGQDFKGNAAVFDLETWQTVQIESAGGTEHENSGLVWASPDRGNRPVLYPGTEHENSGLVWSPDEKLLVLGKRDGRVQFVDVDARKIVQTTRRHESAVEQLAFSPDSRRLASAAADGSVTMHDAATRQRVASVTLDGRPTALAFSPDGALLAVGGDRASWLLETNLGQVVHQLDGRADSLAFSDDGTQLVGVAIDGGRRRWDVASGKQTAEDIAHPTHSEARKFKWSPDRRFVAVYVDELALHVWRTEDAQPMGAIGILNDDVLYVSPSGHYRTSLDARKHLVHVVLTESGEQQLLTPDEFEQQYGWKNDPAQVQPLVEPPPAAK